MKFKPNNNEFIYLCFIANLLSIVIIIGGIIKYIDEKDISIFLLGLGFLFVILLIFIIVRKLYKYRYVINEEYLIKYKKKEIIFKIKITDIEVVAIEKHIDILWCLISILFCGVNNIFTSFRICYRNCDVVTNNSNNYFYDLKDTKYNDCYQYGDQLSYRQISKMIKYMKVKKL